MSDEGFENELNVPSIEKLESMSMLFEHGMTGIEQEMFLRYMFIRGLEILGPENAGTLFLSCQRDLLEMQERDDRITPINCSRCDIAPELFDGLFDEKLVACRHCKWTTNGGDFEQAIELWNEAHGKSDDWVEYIEEIQ